MGWTEIILWLVIIVNTIILVTIVFVERKNTNVVLAWVLVFVFLPYLGFLLYFFFGSNNKMKILSRKYKLDIIEKEYKEEVLKVLQRDDLIKSEDVFELVINENNPLHLLTTNNTVELYTKPKETFAKMFEDIEKAEKSIDIAYYIIKPKHEIAQRLFQLLIKKANEGVRVRLIYDRLSSLETRYNDFAELKKAGVEVYPYLPSFIKRLLIVNYHYHRKMLIIDGSVAHIGGINIADEYHGESRRGDVWRDTNIRITGSAVSALQFRYLADFAFLARQCKKNVLDDKTNINNMVPSPTIKGKMPVQVISSGPDSEYPYIRDSYYKMIILAKDYLYIQTPYFTPDENLIAALRVSALNGCDVRLMLPIMTDIKMIYYINSAFAKEMAKYGVKVYYYNGFIHSKTMVIDDKISTVGTTNFDNRSFSLGYEVNAFIYDKEFAKQMKETFVADLKKADELLMTDIKKATLFDRFLESICRFLGPLV